MNKFNYRLLTLGILMLLFPSSSLAQEVSDQTINLEPGWNIVSTPRVVSSHTFSAPETSVNFDIFVLDSSSPTGWFTMADLGQTEFTPLYGYFINNKTGSQQSLTLNYDLDLSPNERLFERTFASPGWYSIGVANSGFAVAANALYSDINNPSSILSLLDGSYDLVVDFTSALYSQNRASVAVTNPWEVVLPTNINDLNDMRETKGYAIYITEADARYVGIQGTDENNGGNTSGAPIELKVVDAVGNNAAQQIALYGDEGEEDTNIIMFEVENESDTDVTLNDFSVTISANGADVSDVIESLNAEAAYSVWSPVASSVASIDVLEVDTVEVVFQDLDLELSAWESATIRVRADILPFGGDFTEGDSITVSVNPKDTSWSATDEYGNTLDQSYSSGSSNAGPYTYVIGQPIAIPVDGFSWDTDTLGQNDTIGEFTLEFEITALERNFFITDFASTSATTNGVQFTIEGASGFISTASLSSTADEDTSGVFTVREGETETFTLVVSVDPATTGVYRVSLDEVWFSANTDGVTGSEVFHLTPVTDFRTVYQAIQGA